MNPTELLLLDAKTIRPGGASSGIELCDLLTKDGDFVHIKRKSRSSTLSHLFAQGNISAITFLEDGHFRDEIRKEIRAKTISQAEKTKWLALIPDSSSKVERGNFSVSYVVIVGATRTSTNWLPFFSKLNLMQAGRNLQNLSFKVSLTKLMTP